VPPLQAEPIINGYHCNMMETFGNPCSVMNVPMVVVDGENVMNTDDKVDSLSIMLLTVFVWNLTSLLCSYYNIIGALITNSYTLLFCRKFHSMS
jgi:hypothetical protein